MNVFSQDYEAKLLEQNLTAFNRFWKPTRNLNQEF